MGAISGQPKGSELVGTCILKYVHKEVNVSRHTLAVIARSDISCAAGIIDYLDNKT
jgi:hypothetical protein